MVRRLAALVLPLAATCAAAQPPSPADATRPAYPVTTTEVFTRESGKPVAMADLPPPRRFVTSHRTVIRGRPVRYVATAGDTTITSLHNEPIARFFSFDYVRTDISDPTRPVAFIFNGGPGSSSVWLHMGVFGPRRVVLDREVNPSPVPPFGVRDNPFSILDVADLVFVDPVGTGFSHAVGNARDADFFGVDADAESVARFVEQWLSDHRRWNARKYLIGESYGSVRAAVLPRALMGSPLYTGVMRGITVDGVVLLGLTLDSGVVQPPGARRADAPDPAAGLDIVAMATTAWYHRKAPGRDAAQVYEEAAAFARSTYADALHRLDEGTLPDAEKAQVAARLAALTGIPADTWVKGKLRLATSAFLKQILAADGLEAGAYDSRYTLPLAGSGGDPVADDPAMGRYVPGFVSAFHQMLAGNLKVTLDEPYYAIKWEGLNFPWRYARLGVPAGQGYAVDLATAMRRNPALRVLAASGYYDMVTPPAKAEDQIRRGGLPRDRVTLRNYASGHMLYLGDTAAAFAEDVRRLILAGAASTTGTSAARPAAGPIPGR